MIASSAAKVDRSRLESVTAEFGFARRTSKEKGRPIEGAPYDTPIVSHQVIIRNGRPIMSELSLDRIEHNMPCADKHNKDAICTKYLEEMSSFIEEYFNASWVTHYRQGPSAARFSVPPRRQKWVGPYVARPPLLISTFLP